MADQELNLALASLATLGKSPDLLIEIFSTNISLYAIIDLQANKTDFTHEKSTCIHGLA